MNTLTHPHAHDTDEIRAMVRFHYSRIAESEGCGCAPSCCPPGSTAGQAADASRRIGYTADQVAAVPAGANLAIELTELQGMSQSALAERLGISLSGAKSRVQRGRARLKEALLACCRLEFDRRGGVVDCQAKSAGDCPECAH